jgi:hypothetical protein
MPTYPHINTLSYKSVDTWKAIYGGTWLRCFYGDKLGTVNIVLPDEMERRLRVVVAEKGGKKGDLSNTVQLAIMEWLQRNDSEEKKNKTKHR